MKNKSFQVLQLFATVRSCIQTCVSIVCRDLVHGGASAVCRSYVEIWYMVERLQCVHRM
jgi:hypothetical protein